MPVKNLRNSLLKNKIFDDREFIKLNEKKIKEN